MGRPDMAVYKFSRKANLNQTINIYNYGNHSRDFSYVDDTVKSISLIIKNFRKLKQYQLIDIGKGKTDSLKKLIFLIKKKFDKKIKIKKISMQKGDVKNTKANVKKLKKIINYSPKTNLKEGIEKFVNWYKNYHN